MPSYSLNPQDIDGETWFYDSRRGLLVVREVRDNGVYIRTDQFTIPWRAVVDAVRRHNAAPKTRRGRATSTRRNPLTPNRKRK